MRGRRLLPILLDIVFVAVLALYVAGGRKLVPFHGDESTFLWMSHDYHTLVHERDFGAVTFGSRPDENYREWLRLLNGSINPLCIGLAWDSAGLSPDALNKPWRWDTPRQENQWQWRFNVAKGRMPSDRLLHLARVPSTIFTALSVGLVYAIGLGMARSRVVAWVASGLYCVTPSVLLNGRRAMQEGSLLFFTALVIGVALLASRAMQRSGRARAPLGWLAALGVASGAALAAKHSSALVVAAGLLALLVTPMLRARGGIARPSAEHVASLIATALLALLVFQLLMPVWWSWPLSLVLAGLTAGVSTFCVDGPRRRRWATGCLALVLGTSGFVAQPSLLEEVAAVVVKASETRGALMSRQVGNLRQTGSWVRNARTLVRETFLPDPQYFEDPAWESFPSISAQIDRYEATRYGGVCGRFWAALRVGLCLVGGMALYRRWPSGAALLLVAWLAIPALTLLANPLPWQRYYVVLQAPVALLAGLGAGRLVDEMSSRGNALAARLPGGFFARDQK